jgi:hypothetical protein
MTTDPDALELDYDYERSRAAVAIACLRWLGHTGPPGEWAANPESPAISQPKPASPDLDFDPDGPHPLWDRWIDG